MKEIDLLHDRIVESISENALPTGGFANHKNGSYRPDATAWAVVAISSQNVNYSLLQSAREALKITQMSDGGVALQIDQPQTCWPTPLAIIAWHGEKEFVGNENKAINFMLNSSGLHWEKKDSVVGHDTMIKGWPWIQNTHSWVEPTAIAMIALEVAGRNSHPRVQEATRMLLDRQLISGGWNYGNTTVFSKQLRPMPESTGIALSAIYGKADEEKIFKSLEYLKYSITALKTPMSLAWGLLGLSTWGIIPSDKAELIDRCLGQQTIFGIYSTVQLSMLLISLIADNGIVNLVTGNDRQTPP